MYIMYAVRLFEASKHLIRTMEVEPILNVQYLLFRDVCGSTDTKVVGLIPGSQQTTGQSVLDQEPQLAPEAVSLVHERVR